MPGLREHLRKDGEKGRAAEGREGRRERRAGEEEAQRRALHSTLLFEG
jgi:hypothetical protein